MDYLLNDLDNIKASNIDLGVDGVIKSLAELKSELAKISNAPETPGEIS